jgi:putative copper export protein
MIKFTLYKSARAVRTFHATDVHAALAQCPEMNNPTVFVHGFFAHQWVGGETPYELIAE